MPPPFAREFTPELNQGYLAQILNRNVDQESAEVARARKEGESEGLVGQAATGSRIGAAENNFDNRINGEVSQFNLGVAEKQYGERMNDEDKAFREMERQKNEDFKREMTEMGYRFEDNQREMKRQNDSQFNTGGFLAGLTTAAVGGASKGAGAAAGAAAMA